MTGHVLIAGGGIGGLTAALALHARGIDVTVVDRTDLRPLGVGINLLPHAVRELTTLGLGHELSAISVAPAALGYYDSRGTLLFTEPRGIDGGYGHP
jgi:5-methylphenazine-1-carboxylate 1-monooxygenase